MIDNLNRHTNPNVLINEERHILLNHPPKINYVLIHMTEGKLNPKYTPQYGHLISIFFEHPVQIENSLIYELRRYIVPVTEVIDSNYTEQRKRYGDLRTLAEIYSDREKQKLDLAARTIALIQEVRLNTGR